MQIKVENMDVLLVDADRQMIESFFITDLHIHGAWYPWGYSGTNSQGILRDGYINWEVTLWKKGNYKSNTWIGRILRKRKSQDNSWRISRGKRKNMLDRLARSVKQERMKLLIETLPVSIFFLYNLALFKSLRLMLRLDQIIWVFYAFVCICAFFVSDPKFWKIKDHTHTLNYTAKVYRAPKAAEDLVLKYQVIEM